MTKAAPESLIEQFEALHAERVRTWPTEKLNHNINQRLQLEKDFDPSAILQVGDIVEDFELQDSDGGKVTLEELVSHGPAILIFFRFAGCPACNVALPYYNRQLWPSLAKAGIPLVAISPHLVEKGLGDIVARHSLDFIVASDKDNLLGRRFGLTFSRDVVPEGPQAPGWIGELTGTGTQELPQPAVIIIDRDRIARFVSVSPDWLARPEAKEILEALDQINASVALS